MSQTERIDELLERWEQADPKPALPDLCRDHPDLLLAVGERVQKLMAMHAFTRHRPASTNGEPAVIGNYRILERLGEGGMGCVYKAEQREPVRRIVALKVIRLGLATRDVMARFDAERQALARMEHPSIAKMLDAGSDEQGRPYFVMEYVPAVPITTFADQRRLTLRQRLNLFLDVCSAVSHAHTKAILHRDIKASNVLAFERDGQCVVKVIDFGVAKALTGDRLTERTVNTDYGSAIGSLESMSPEQADGSPDIDTRSDVYSLGVLLYELLIGVKPFAREQLKVAGDMEARRVIREVAPRRPSTQLTQMADAAKACAEARRQSIDEIRRELSRDLEWIPLKALSKERDRRYESVARMADDVRAYLDGRPLAAAPDGLGYRLAKAYRRHRASVAWALANSGVMLACIWWSWFARLGYPPAGPAWKVSILPNLLISAGLLQAAFRITGLAPKVLHQLLHVLICYGGGALLATSAWIDLPWLGADPFGLRRFILLQAGLAVLCVPAVMALYRTSWGKALLIQLFSIVLTSAVFVTFCFWALPPG